ncbi:MAG: universal stress protein [Nitrosopumilaceae archaeon]
MAIQKIKKILVPLDGSKNSFRALNKAIFLARQTDSKITGFFVIQNNPSELAIIRNFLKGSLKKQYQSFMRKAKTQCKKNDIEFIDILEYGHEGNTIVSFAGKNDFDLIVIGSRGLQSIKEFFLGSTSSYVVHNSKIPVMIVK